MVDSHSLSSRPRRRGFAIALIAVCAAVFVPQSVRAAEEPGGYFNGRKIALDAQAGMGMLTDSDYEPIDYYPGYGVSVEYYFPAVLAMGFEFEQIQKNGDITIPTKNFGNLEGSGRLMLSALTVQAKLLTPRFGRCLFAFLDFGFGAYIVNLDTKTNISVDYGGQEYDFDYKLNYTIVENGMNGGIGLEAVFRNGLKLGIGTRIHYILEQEKDTDFGAMNLFVKIGYSR